MNDTLKIAQAVGFNTEHAATNEYLRRFAEMIRADEREACIDLFKEGLWDGGGIANAIRARGDK